jgi:hypothetical protein
MIKTAYDKCVEMKGEVFIKEISGNREMKICELNGNQFTGPITIVEKQSKKKSNGKKRTPKA